MNFKKYNRLIHLRDFNKPYLLLLAGRFVSQLGDKLYLIALPWLVLELTHSALNSSITLALEILPMIVLAPFIGVFVDRKSRKRLMVAADFIRGIIIGTITILAIMGSIEMIHIYIAAFLLSAFTLVFDSSSEGYLPRIIQKDKLVDANATLTFVNTLMRIIGPIIGGVLIKLIGAEGTIGLNAISFLISGIILVFLPALDFERLENGKKVTNIIDEIKEGFKYLFSHEVLFPIAIYSTFMNIGIFLSTTLLIFESKETLGYDSTETAIIFTVSGIVAVLTTMSLKYLKKILTKGQIILYGSVGVFLATLLLVFNQSLVSLTIAYSVILMIGIIVNVNMMAYRQEVIPANLFGRVMTSTKVLTNIFGPLAMILAGYLAMEYSAQLVFALSAIIIFFNLLYARFSTLKDIK